MSEPVLDLSVVIPAHNATATLAHQLEALIEAPVDLRIEIMVVDNNSTDGTADLVAAYGRRDERVRLVPATTGSGPSHARNVGIAAARCELVACCDADDIVAAGWLVAMFAALQTNTFVAGALDVDRLNEAWVIEGRGRSITHGSMSFGGVTFPHGCNLGVHRAVFLEHRFDEALRAGEEIDLAIRMAAAGVECVYVPDAVVHYRYRTTLRETWRQAFIGARVRPHLERRLGRSGRPRILRRSGWLVVRSAMLRSRAGRIRWVWIAASVSGEIVGWIRDPVRT